MLVKLWKKISTTNLNTYTYSRYTNSITKFTICNMYSSSISSKNLIYNSANKYNFSSKYNKEKEEEIPYKNKLKNKQMKLENVPVKNTQRKYMRKYN